MEPFCLSLGISNSCQVKLQKFSSELEIQPNITDYFYHTTFMQGLTNHYKELSRFLLEIKVKFFEKYLNELILWDRFTKKINKTYVEKYDDDLSALILPYGNSNFLNYFSLELNKILMKKNFLLNRKVDIFKYKNLIKTSEINKYQNIIDYDYKSRMGLINPHTTLGFIKNNYKEEEISKLFNNNYIEKLDIKHDGIYLSPLNNFCMTSSINRITLLTL